MKKEKREITLEKLERRENIAKEVPTIILILAFIVFMVGIVMTIILGTSVNIYEMLSIYICIEMLLAVLLIMSYKISEKTRNQMISKKKQVKVSVLKQLANVPGGCIKEFVNIRDEEIISDILSKNIFKISIDKVTKDSVITTIQFVDNTFQSNVYISIEKLISIINEECRDEILKQLIKEITLKELDKKITRVSINTQGLLYVKDFTFDELSESFDLKE